MSVITYVHADPGVGRIEGGIAKIAGTKIKLLPESRVDVRDVILAIFAKILPISIDDRSGVVIDAGDLFFINWNDDHHVVLPASLLHQFCSWTFRNFFNGVVPTRLLLSTKIRRGEDFLHTKNLHTLLRRVFDHREMLFDI